MSGHVKRSPRHGPSSVGGWRRRRRASGRTCPTLLPPGCGATAALEEPPAARDGTGHVPTLRRGPPTSQASNPERREDAFPKGFVQDCGFSASVRTGHRTGVRRWLWRPVSCGTVCRSAQRAKCVQAAAGPCPGNPGRAQEASHTGTPAAAVRPRRGPEQATRTLDARRSLTTAWQGA